jgi:AcrR family transcriptional regulator
MANVIRPKSRPDNPSAKSHKPSHSTKSNERPHEIVHAAYQTLAENGFEGLRMREIAKRAWIDHSTLHYYFSGKEALIDGVVDYIVQELAIGRPELAIGWLWPPKRWLGWPGSTKRRRLLAASRFFYYHRIGRRILTTENQMGLIGHDPLDCFALLKLDGLGQGGREIDVPLLAVRKAPDPPVLKAPTCAAF